MTDRNVRVLFWQLAKVRAQDADFEDCIEEISGQPDLLAYTECTGGLKLRAERLSIEDGRVEGDFVRQQSDNVPPIALEGAPLEANLNPIGHRAAFIYSVPHQVLALQAARPGVSPALIGSYIRRRIAQHKGFYMYPCLTNGALQRIQEGSPKKVEFKVARPADIAHIEPEFEPLENSLAFLQNFVDGQAIEFTIGREKGNREALLNPGQVVRLIQWATGNRHHVEKARVTIDEEVEAIDIFAERMDFRGQIHLNAEDLDEAFEQRREFLRQAFNGKLGELNNLYLDQQ